MVGLGTLAERLTAVGTGRVSYRGGGGGGEPGKSPPPKGQFSPTKNLGKNIN